MNIPCKHLFKLEEESSTVELMQDKYMVGGSNGGLTYRAEFIKLTKKETTDLRIWCFSLRDTSKPVCLRERTDMNTVRISLSKSET